MIAKSGGKGTRWDGVGLRSLVALNAEGFADCGSIVPMLNQ